MGEHPRKPRGNQPAAIESDAACVSVDAGAGTGKTTTMLMRIERAIEDGEINPEDVLVLTFANEAAANVREAITDRLGPEEAAEIDVYTYHSFCHRLVREYAYYLGISPEFDVLTGRGRRRILEGLLDDGDYGFATPATRGDGSAADLAGTVEEFVATMSREGIDPETLAARLPDVRTLEVLGEFALRLDRVADEHLSFANEALRYFNRESYLEGGREALVEYGKVLTVCLERIAEAPEEYRDDPVVRDVEHYLEAMRETVTTVHGALSLDDRVTKHLPRALFGDEIHGTATDLLEQSPAGRLESYLEFLRLARHYTDVYADYRAYLGREGVVDFDELVRTATRLLEDEGVADEVTGQWEQVYCDEFQDTDATQFDLVTRLTHGEKKPDLFAIGDKDQSIYGWRGTDRKGLDRLASVYDDYEAVELVDNFRSKQEILDLTNGCRYGFGESKTLSEIDRARGTYEEEDPPLRVGRIDTDGIDVPTAEGVATTISKLLNGELEGVPRRELDDLAVIVRTNRQAMAVASALGDVQIPYKLSGSARGELSPGTETVLSYLRVLVDPTADAHLRRVLLYRYRLPKRDLEALGSREGSLYDALLEADPEAVDGPTRLERAREDLEALRSMREVYPLPVYLRRVIERSRLAWFLSSDEREDVERIERFAESYDPGAILGTLSAEFVDALESVLTGGGNEYDRGSHTDDHVDVMTVHQAKGLGFDTVLLPYLSDEEWCLEGDYARRARYELLTATIEGEVDSPLCGDVAAETTGEEWRVLHVALTRAENHLFVFGSTYDYEGEDDQLSTSLADACLADGIEWSVAGKRMNLWERLTESFERVRDTYPESVADLTEEVAFSAGQTPGTITYYEAYGERAVEPIETAEAIETVHRLGRLLRTGSLLPAADAADCVAEAGRVPTGRSAGALTLETVRFPVDALSSVSELPLAMSHSYTSMQSHETCARKHYLDHVVNAIDDPVEGGGDGGGRTVGTVFHAVAEEAFHREYTQRETWHEAATRQLTARDDLEYREDVLASIDRYFEATAAGVDAPLREWKPLAAELPFSLEDVPGVTGEVVGYVDSIRRTPDGELAVLDYKTTGDPIPAEEATQLSLYLRACREQFDEPVSHAGYVYVGEGGPRVDLFTAAELPPWESVAESLEAAETFSLEATPGGHCRFCPHQSLGCAPDWIEADD
ncbi:UvrD-helicase domain-containing protein [Natrialbaceae archaeon A-gly3]